MNLSTRQPLAEPYKLDALLRAETVNASRATSCAKLRNADASGVRNLKNPALEWVTQAHLSVSLAADEDLVSGGSAGERDAAVDEGAGNEGVIIDGGDLSKAVSPVVLRNGATEAAVKVRNA